MDFFRAFFDSLVGSDVLIANFPWVFVAIVSWCGVKFSYPFGTGKVLEMRVRVMVMMLFVESFIGAPILRGSQREGGGWMDRAVRYGLLGTKVPALLV